MATVESAPRDDGAALGPSWGLALLFALCAAAALVPLWIAPYPPMVDLPQNAAQVSIWLHHDEPAFGFARQFELHYFTPNLLGYALGRLFAAVFDIVTASKLVVSLAILALPAALWLLLRETRLDRAWALVGFPLAYGFSFYWGSQNYLLGVPLCLAFLALAARAKRRPGLGGELVLALFGALLFFLHALVWAFGVLCAALVAARDGAWRRPRALLRQLWPLLAAVPLAIVWTLQTRASAPLSSHSDWAFSAGRFLELPGLILGAGGDPAALGWLGALALLAVAALRPGRLSTQLPALAAAAVVLFGPLWFFGTFQIYQRFAIFIVPLLLFGAAPRARPWLSPRLVRLGLAGLVLVWLGILALRFSGFARETAGFAALVDAMEPGRSLCALSFAPKSEHVPAPPHLFSNFAAWYQARKGGVVQHSFGESFAALAHYREGQKPRSTYGLSVWPSRFRWAEDGGYDYYLVRAPDDLGPWLFREAKGAVRPVANAGLWWLYEQPRAPSSIAPAGVREGAPVE